MGDDTRVRSAICLFVAAVLLLATLLGRLIALPTAPPRSLVPSPPRSSG
jgi:hypothetical protein